MEHDKHTLIFSLLAVVFIVLSGAIFRLYREQVNMKIMMSEGFMQIKEEMKVKPSISITPVATDSGKVMKK